MAKNNCSDTIMNTNTFIINAMLEEYQDVGIVRHEVTMTNPYEHGTDHGRQTITPSQHLPSSTSMLLYTEGLHFSAI